jgi:hypothetical protein
MGDSRANRLPFGKTPRLPESQRESKEGAIEAILGQAGGGMVRTLATRGRVETPCVHSNL